MTVTIQTILLLLAVLVIVAVVARRLNIAASILLVAAGIALALIPGLPRIELAPELVLLGILPPLLYSAGVAMSWREFRFNLRPIAQLAFGCVLFTAAAVAAVCGCWAVLDVLAGYGVPRPAAEGADGLIAAGQARPIRDAADLACALAGEAPVARMAPSAFAPLLAALTARDAGAAELSRCLVLSLSATLALIAEAELGGWVVRRPGGLYGISREAVHAN